MEVHGDMPLIDYVKLYGSDVAKVLDRGETLVDMGSYREPLIGDESRLTRTVDELSPRLRQMVEEHGPAPKSDKIIEGFDPLRGGVQVNPRRIDQVLGGISGEGGPESAAGRLWRAGKGDGSRYYAVTDRRLLLLAQAAIGSGEYTIVFDLPRTAVASARRRGKLMLQRGRVEVRFTDGSMKAWTTGLLSTARARSLVAALSGPITQTGM
jgi:hypothetical protein